MSQPSALYPQLPQLGVCIEALLGLEGVDATACQKLQEKLTAHTFNILVVGQYNRGKTTLINALVGEPLLPVGVIPLTSVVTVLSYGETPLIKVCFQDGRCVETTPEALGEYVTEKGNPHNHKQVREVEVSYPSPWLRDGVRLVDTPGIGSVFLHNTDLAYRYLPQADAVLFLLSADQPVSQAELDFLQDVRQYADRIFFLLNKADYLSETELQDALGFARITLGEVMGQQACVIPVSARQGLDGKAGGLPLLVEQSRLPLLYSTLQTFLQRDKGAVLAGSIARNLLRIIAQARFNRELELKALIAPLTELEKNLRVFALKKQEVVAAQDEYRVLMTAEVKKLQQQVEDDLTTCKQELKQIICRVVQENYQQNRSLPSRALSKLLEETVATVVRERFDTWRSSEDAQLSQLFERVCTRFTDKINKTVDELLHFSAELFAIPFSVVQAEALTAAATGFYYKFWSEPGSMKLFTSSLLLALPKFMSDRLLVTKMQKYAVDCVEVQSGRLRYDFAQRLERGSREFGREMTERLAATANGIESAMTKAIAQRQGSEQEVEARSVVITGQRKRLDELEAEVDNIMQKLSVVCKTA
jgi:GTPase SAR1 family protein